MPSSMLSIYFVPETQAKHLPELLVSQAQTCAAQKLDGILFKSHVCYRVFQCPINVDAYLAQIKQDVE
nr:unnamed protein product [Callosobruchus analis]